MRSGVVLAALALAACGQGAAPSEQAPLASDAATVAASADAAEATAAPVPTPAPPSVAPKAKAAAAPAAPEAQQEFSAFGTEPFWGFKVFPEKLVYDSPEVPKGITFAATMKWQGKRRIYTGILQGKPITLTIEPGTCSDGMSDNVWPYKVEFTRENWTVQGCAVPK